ncbi:hypothetical protein D3C73_1508450 [compost metagenome]
MLRIAVDQHQIPAVSSPVHGGNDRPVCCRFELLYQPPLAVEEIDDPLLTPEGRHTELQPR